MKSIPRWLWLVFISLVLVACSTIRPVSASSQPTVKEPKKQASSRKNDGAYFQNDGPAAHIPVNLDLVPNAVPQDEPLIKSANLPYTALGMSFRPTKAEKPYHTRGKVSWYGKQFHGRKTTSGERYNMFAMTGAHPTLPIPSYVKVTNLKNGRSVIVRVNDRGPFHRGRVMDLSYAAANRLGYVKAGSADVLIERVFPVDGGTRIATRPDTMLDQNEEPIFLQLGSYAKLADAESRLRHLSDQLSAEHDPKLAVVNQRGVYRVRLGPYYSENAASEAARQLNLKQLVML